MEVIWNINALACGHATPLYPLFKEHVCLIWLHFVGLSAPAVFHLKIIIYYRNRDVKLNVGGAQAVNKHKIVHRTGCKLFLGLGIAGVCMHPPKPRICTEQPGRLWGGVRGRNCPFQTA